MYGYYWCSTTEDYSTGGKWGKCPADEIPCEVTCDNVMKLYADGTLIGSSDDWQKTTIVSVPTDTEEIRIECTDVGSQAGIIASCGDDDLLTDDSWQCSVTGSDDWSSANVIGKNGVWPWNDRIGDGISPNAQWIWHGEWNLPTDQEVTCKNSLKKEDGFTCVPGWCKTRYYMIRDSKDKVAADCAATDDCVAIDYTEHFGYGHLCRSSDANPQAHDYVVCSIAEIHHCDSADNGDCSQICNKNGDAVECSCESGYLLGADGKTCDKIHPCDKPSKGGCSQICNKEGEGFECSCASEYVLGADGQSCYNIHPCDAEHNGDCMQICDKNGEDADCSCIFGYALDVDGKSCSKIHPCDAGNNGDCSQVCDKNGEEFECSCEPGYVLDQDGKTCLEKEDEMTCVLGYCKRRAAFIIGSKDKVAVDCAANEDCVAIDYSEYFGYGHICLSSDANPPMHDYVVCTIEKKEVKVECIEQTKVFGANIRLEEGDGKNHMFVTEQNECLDLCDEYPDCASIEYNVGSGKCQINSEVLDDTDPRGTYSKWTYCQRR